METSLFREMADIQGRHWWFVSRRMILASVISGFHLRNEARILEIGCGTGGNLEMLEHFGQLSAMEYDEHARIFARELGVCPVAAGRLPEPVPFEDGTFDLVCLLDVLEHIENDEEALIRVARLLNASGHLLVTVPAYDWLWSAHDVAHHHHRRYTTKLLKQRAQQSNLKVKKIGYFNTLLFPLIAVARLTGKLSKRESSNVSVPKPLINSLLGKIFGFERFIIPRMLFPFGTSILVVLSRPE